MIRFRTYILLFGIACLMAACAPTGDGEETPKPTAPTAPVKPAPELPTPPKQPDPVPTPVPVPQPPAQPAPVPAPPIQPVPPAPPPVPPKTVYLINGMSPEEFYGQFFVKLGGACDRKDVTYQYPRSYMVKIGMNDQRQDVLAELSIVMKAEGTYRAIYHEVDVWEGPFGLRLWINDRFKVLKGKWNIVKDKVVFETLGMAIGFMNNNRPTVRLRFDQDLIFPGIKDRTLLLVNSVNDRAPFSDLNPCDL